MKRFEPYAMMTDRLEQHHKYDKFPRRLEDPLPMRDFSLRPEEPDAQPGDKLLGWIAAIAIAIYLIYQGLRFSGVFK